MSVLPSRPVGNGTNEPEKEPLASRPITGYASLPDAQTRANPVWGYGTDSSPETGGGGLPIDWLKYLGKLSSVFGGAAESASKTNQSNADRALKTYTAQQQSILDALGLTDTSTMDRANLDLKQREFALTAPQQRAKTSMMGDYLSSFQPMQITAPKGVNMPKISGGATISDSTRQMGQLLTALAFKQQPYDGDVFSTPAAPDYMGNLLTPPNSSPASSWSDKLLGGLGLGTSILGALYGK